jgi:hypothetical protein
VADTVNVEVVGEPSLLERPVSWRAVLAGVVIALVVQLLLALLGTGIGLAMVDPTASDNPDASTMSISALIWWTVSGIIASALGGLTAGRLSGRPGSSTAGWHGLVSWATTTLVIFYLLSTAVGSIIGGAFGLVGSVAEGAAGVASTVAPSVAEATDPFSSVQTELNDALGVRDPASAREAVTGIVRNAVTADGSDAEQAMTRASEVLARSTRTTPEEARQRLSAWKETYDQTVEEGKQQAQAAADTARSAASMAGIGSVIALVLGAIAAWFGGLKSPIPADIYTNRRV